MKYLLWLKFFFKVDVIFQIAYVKQLQRRIYTKRLGNKDVNMWLSCILKQYLTHVYIKLPFLYVFLWMLMNASEIWIQFSNNNKIQID